MRFTINLATKTYINHRLVNLSFAVTAILLLLMLVWNTKSLFTGQGEADRLKADISKYEVQLNSRPAGVTEQEYTRMQSDIRFYNSVIDRKTSDWIGLLDKLEKVTPEGVALTSFAPDPKSREIKIEGETRSFARVLSYLEKLEGAGFFRDVQLLSHQESSSADKSRILKFAISFQAVSQ